MNIMITKEVTWKLMLQPKSNELAGRVIHDEDGNENNNLSVHAEFAELLPFKKIMEADDINSDVAKDSDTGSIRIDNADKAGTINFQFSDSYRL